MRRNILMTKYTGIAITAIFFSAFSLYCAPEKGSTSSELDQSGFKQIDKSWMGAIHGSTSTATENKNSPAGAVNNSKNDAAKESDSINIFPNPADVDPQKEARDEIQAVTNPEATEEAPSLVSVAFRFAAMLIIMVGLFYLVARYMKLKNGVLHPGNDLVQVIASVPLMPGKFLQIVDMAGRLMVLGVSESGVSMISEIEDASTADRIRIWNANNPRSQLPDNVLGRLTTLIRGSEFKFWNNENGPDQKSNSNRTSFSSMLGQATGNTTAVNTSPAGELTELLKSQKKKIQKMKNGNTDDTSLFDGT